MKKLCVILFALCLLLSLTACGEPVQKPAVAPDKTAAAPTPAESPTEAAEPAEGSEDAGEIEAAEEPAPDYAPWWGGKWYGWGVFMKGSGVFFSQTDDTWDVVAQLDVEGDRGDLLIWDYLDDSEPDLSARVHFGPGASEHGQMVCESCTFLDSVFARGFFTCDPALAPESRLEHVIVIRFLYTSAENNADSVQVCYVLRPWGMLWEDAKEADTSGMIYDDMMPLHYEDWYLVQLQQEGGA